MLPAPRFYYMVPPYRDPIGGAYHIIDTHRIPRGWFHSTPEERRAAVVEVIPSGPFNPVWGRMQQRLTTLNSGEVV